MRIIGGKYRGKKLFSPLSDQIRPTSDKAREAVFNILFSKLSEPWSNLTVADIFSGTGALAYEALSRGAKEVTLVDADIATAAKNAGLFVGEKKQIKILRANAENLPVVGHTFDIVFSDAPYHQGLSEKALNSLLNAGWLSAQSLIIVETAVDEDLAIPPAMCLLDKRCYGIASFYFLRLNS